MADPVFIVTFHGTPDEDARRALSGVGAGWIGGHGLPTPGGDLANANVQIAAPSEEAAVSAVRDALAGRGGFSDFRASPASEQ